jgi:hypothetical protein
VFYITGGPRDLMPYIPTVIELREVNRAKTVLALNN